MTPTVTDTQIGARIVELREQRGLSQGELSSRLRSAGLNWSQGTLSRVELGQRPVRLSECPPLTLALRTDLAVLLGEEQAPAAARDLKPHLVGALPALNTARTKLETLAAELQRACADAADAHRLVKTAIRDFEGVLTGGNETG